MKIFNNTLLIFVFVTSVLAGCDGISRSNSSSEFDGQEFPLFISESLNGNYTAHVNQQLADLRHATAPYHLFRIAQEDGYTNQLTGCMDSSEGGMGFHYAKSELLDATVRVERPESLMYEPGLNGTLRLVGVEYIVPFDTWSKTEPPMLVGRHFHPNEEFGIWALHIWIWKHNPNGLFADWNPRVSC